ncbi:MAG: TRAP transporter substrate-binding protein DctP [Sandaracinaceae bacterium]|nr:TRAP transporter substrate-binding protein DctP [Sandaracinaceae bacterium]
MRALAALTLLGCAPAHGEAEVWRFAIEETAGSVQHTYATRLAERVEERTGGAVRVVVYPYGALGTSDQITEQLYMDTLELATSSPGHLGKLIAEVQVFLIPFALAERSSTNARALADPALRAFLDALYAEKGLAFLAAFGEGPMAWTTRRPVRRPEDFEGVRMRVMTSPLSLAAFEAYGARPTPLPYGEVYSALQLRMIDGQVNPVFAIEEMSFYEVADVLTFPHDAEFVTTLAASPRWLARLSPARRRMLEDVVAELQGEIHEVQARLNADRLATIRARRPALEVVDLTPEERAPFRARARAVRALYVERVGPRGAALLEHLDRAIAQAEADAPSPPAPPNERRAP